MGKFPAQMVPLLALYARTVVMKVLLCLGIVKLNVWKYLKKNILGRLFILYVQVSYRFSANVPINNIASLFMKIDM